jgi:hypothetical protein
MAGNKKMSPLQFKRRVQTLHMAVSGYDTPTGALTWASSEGAFNCSRRAVYAWASGDRPLNGLVIRVLELLEEKYSEDLVRAQKDFSSWQARERRKI